MHNGLDQRLAHERKPPHFLARRQTQDVDSHGSCLTGWQGVYEHVGRLSFLGEVSELWMWPIQIIRERLDQPCVWRGGAWPGALVFMSVKEARGNFSVSGRALRSSALTMLPSDLTSEGINSAPVESLVVVVKQSVLMDHAKRVCGMEIPESSLRQSLVIDNPDAFATFEDCAHSILDALGACPMLLEQEGFRVTVKERVLCMLVTLLETHMAKAQRLSPPTTRSYVVNKAVQLIESRLADPLDVMDLCRALRVSPRTLRYSFEEVLGVSPTQFLMSLRLGRVRRAFLQDSKISNVQCVAARFGFSHMGRFARFYNEAFGERPSETLRRKDTARALPRTDMARTG
jgi:AraC family transcriptional regulator, ethanolamine operon transcriptional activator